MSDNRFECGCERGGNCTKTTMCQCQDMADEIERLRADCKDKQRLIETQKQYLDNRDSVIKGMNKMIKELEAPLAAIYDKWPEFDEALASEADDVVS